MENDKEMREKFSRVLGAPNNKRGIYDYKDERITYSWEEIFCEIGKLQEKASTPRGEFVYPNFVYPNKDYVTTPTNTPVHYHNGNPCHQNPCIWC